MVITLSATPFYQSKEEFYTVNNPFQINGPKGYYEVKVLENGDLYVRTDLPGIGQDNVVDVRINDSKKSVTSRTLAESSFNLKPYEDFTPRSYATTALLMCDCCQISQVTHKITDGVLRVVISTTANNNKETPPQNRAHHAILNNTFPDDPRLTGPTLSKGHPDLVQGQGTGAYEFKVLPDGGAYVRLDMPGVPKDKFITRVDYGELKANGRSRNESRVFVTGTAPAVDHDSGGREYSALAAIVYDSTRAILLETNAENGVMRLTVRP